MKSGSETASKRGPQREEMGVINGDILIRRIDTEINKFVTAVAEGRDPVNNLRGITLELASRFYIGTISTLREREFPPSDWVTALLDLAKKEGAMEVLELVIKDDVEKSLKSDDSAIQDATSLLQALPKEDRILILIKLFDNELDQSKIIATLRKLGVESTEVALVIREIIIVLLTKDDGAPKAQEMLKRMNANYADFMRKVAIPTLLTRIDTIRIGIRLLSKLNLEMKQVPRIVAELRIIKHLINMLLDKRQVVLVYSILHEYADQHPHRAKILRRDKEFKKSSLKDKRGRLGNIDLETWFGGKDKKTD